MSPDPKNISEEEKLEMLARILQKHDQELFTKPNPVPDLEAKVQTLMALTLFARKARRRPYSKWLPMAALLLVGINATLFYAPLTPKQNDSPARTSSLQEELSPFAQEGVLYSNTPSAGTPGDLEKAKILFRHHYYPEALNYASIVLQQNPKNLEALSLIRDCDQKLGRKKDRETQEELIRKLEEEK